MSAREKEKESSQLSSPVHFESRNLAVPALASGRAAPPAGAAAGDAGRGREDAEKPGTPCCAHAEGWKSRDGCSQQPDGG